MNNLYVFIDVCSFLLASFLAIFFGNVSLPNPAVFVLVFFFFRTSLFYILFQKLIKRDLPLARILFQGFVLVVLVLTTSFIISLIPVLKLSPAYFYLLLVPILTILVSFFLQRNFKVEYWLK